MKFGPTEVWKDGDTLLSSVDDRAGALLIAIFAAILGFYIIPVLAKAARSS